MIYPATLTKLSIAILIADGRRIVQRIKKSQGRERSSLWLFIQNLVWMLRKWRLPDFIGNSFVKSDGDIHSKQLAVEYSVGEERYSYDIYTVWEVRVQDISPRGRSVREHPFIITVHSKDSTEFRRFKAFLRHLFLNWLDEIKVQKLYANNTGFLVTTPAPALLYFCPNASSISTSSPNLSRPDSSNAMKVMKVLKKIMKENFRIEFLSEDAIEIKSKSPEGTSKIGDSSKERWNQREGCLRTEEDSSLICTDVCMCGDEITAELLKQQEQCYLTIPLCTDQSSQTNEDVAAAATQTDPESEELKFKNDRLVETVRSLENKVKRQEADSRRAVHDLEKRNNELKTQLIKATNQLEAKEEDLRETLFELGRASVEMTRMMNEKKREAEFDKTFKSVNVTTQTFQPSPSAHGQTSEWSLRTERVAIKSDRLVQLLTGDTEENSQNFTPDVSIQESVEVSSGIEGASLTNMPTTAVERSLYNNYKLLLLTIADQLLSSDVIKLKSWARSILSANVPSDINEVFRDLDRKKVISASDLSKLREFFESILRIDVVHLIDCFLLGDYAPLRSTNSNRVLRTESRRTYSGASSTTAQGILVNSSARLQSNVSSVRQPPQLRHSALPQRDDDKKSLTANPSKVSDASVKAPSLVATCGTENATQRIHQVTREQVVTDGSASNNNGLEDEVDGSRADVNNCTTNSSGSTKSADGAATSDPRFQGDMGSNGNKLSKFQRPDSARNRGSSTQGSDGDDDDDDDEQPWLCSHYKRRCYVKFNCCNKYWPCHRCHNNESNCGKKKLKSRDTEFVKCVKCGTEQKFTSQSQFCTKCHRKFAEYFCPICKHLTGTDDNPYHCYKCGICRIHKDRSFHCDVCGVCLDVQLRGNHRCRAGSAHDECCICLEDAFTGCQILPCSHKVHKECSTQMIRSGITRCPICRESFAHKLERRTLPRSKKPSGK